MNLLSLKYFLAISEYSSFTKAAEHLYVTQPTLSRQIADLEDEFGVPLFIRNKRSVALTPAGEVFFAEAKEIVKRCDELTNRLKYMNGDPSGTLSIGYLGEIEHNLLTKPLQALGSKYPNLNVGVLRASLAELNHFLLDGKFDIIYTVATGMDMLPDLKITKIAKNTLQLAVPVKHPLAQRDSVTIRELEHEQFVMFERNVTPLTTDSIIQMCMRNGFSPFVVHYARDPQTLLLMVSVGKGIAFLSSRAANQIVPGVKFLDILDCDIDFDIVLAQKQDNPNPMIPLFMSLFSDEDFLAELSPED